MAAATTSSMLKQSAKFDMIEELTKEFYSADGMTWPEYQNIVRKMYQEYGLGEEYIDWSEF